MPTDTLLPIIQKSSNTNNGDVFIRDNRSNELLRKRNDTDSNLQQQGTESNDINYDSDELMGSGQIPEMCDSACQTRESLFQVGFNTSSERSSSPHVHVLPSGVRTLDRGVQSPRFSTFGYDDSRGRLDRNDTLPKQSDRYKAEAVIEMDQFRDKSRSKTCTNCDSKRSVNDNTPPSGCDVHYHQKQQQGTPHAFSKSPQNYRVHHEPDSKIRQFDNDKTLIDNRGYSVETTKSAPDVIIMTSH